MHYLILLAIALVTLLLCAGILLVSKKRKLAKPLVVGLILILLTQGGALLWQFGHNDGGSKSDETIAEDAKKSTPKVAATADLPAYEVLNLKNPDAMNTRVTIYTLEKNEQKLINLNRKLKEKYEVTSTAADPHVLFIDYFDDKTVANSYASLISDSKTTTAQKRKLLSHYIAASSPSFKTPENILFLGGQSQIIKQLGSSKEQK